MIFKPGMVVRVPFPFAESSQSKFRPALVLSSEEYNASHLHSVMAMITSAKHSSWPSDILITDLESAGLPNPSVVRFKLFTLDNSLAENPVGMLIVSDWALVIKSLTKILVPR